MMKLKLLDGSGLNEVKMKYPKCSNSNCIHNYEYLCKANGFDEDIVCKQGKADAIRMINNNEGQIKMVRELVSKRKLICILNNKLSKYEECKDCNFDGVMANDKEAGGGCLGANVKFRFSSEPDERCRPFISRILSEAGKKYNIENINST